MTDEYSRRLDGIRRRVEKSWTNGPYAEDCGFLLAEVERLEKELEWARRQNEEAYKTANNIIDGLSGYIRKER